MLVPLTAISFGREIDPDLTSADL